MNERNVKALHRVVWECYASMAPMAGDPTSAVAAYLASRGVLGPASEVLTDEECCMELNDSISAHIICERLERIAKGEA